MNGMDRDRSYYTPDGDIAYLRVAGHEGRVRSRREPWGVGDYDESGALVGVEVWGASERLPQELIAALPRVEGRGIPIERQPA